MNDSAGPRESNRLSTLLDLAAIVNQALVTSGHAVQMRIVLPGETLTPEEIPMSGKAKAVCAANRRGTSRRVREKKALPCVALAGARSSAR